MVTSPVAEMHTSRGNIIVIQLVVVAKCISLYPVLFLNVFSVASVSEDVPSPQLVLTSLSPQAPLGGRGGGGWGEFHLERSFIRVIRYP